MKAVNYSVIDNSEIKQEIIDTKKSARSFTLEEIENKMMELATCPSNDVVVNMLNEKRINMLEKVANLRMRRLQLQELLKEQQIAQIEAKPITVQFVSAKTDDQVKRIEQIDADILSKTTNKQDA